MRPAQSVSRDGTEDANAESLHRQLTPGHSPLMSAARALHQTNRIESASLRRLTLSRLAQQGVLVASCWTTTTAT